MENPLTNSPYQENPQTNSPKEIGSDSCPSSGISSAYADAMLDGCEVTDSDFRKYVKGSNLFPVDDEKDSLSGVIDSDIDKDDVVLDVSPINALDSRLDVNENDIYPINALDSYGNLKKPDVTGAGLANLGNTCFVNAVMQCFIHTVPLLKEVLSDTHSSDCKREGGFCLLCNLRKMVELSLTSMNRVVSPHELVENLSYFSSLFRRYQQEDAHEFLQFFLDRLERCYDVRRSSDVTSPGDNFVKQVFGGRVVSKVKCTDCGHCSDSYEPSIDLSLEIEDADSLFSALQSFTKVEKLEASETKFTCEGCKKQVTIEKQLAWVQVPSIASFHLKRFAHEGNCTQKIDKHVAFPTELNLLPFTSCNGNTGDVELKYELYAVVVHAGQTSTSGHYTSFVRLSPNMWCQFDDSRVFQVHEDTVLSQEAYILFYAQEGTPWFSSFIETQKVRLNSIMSIASPKSVLNTAEASSYSPVLQGKTSDGSNEASVPSGSDHFVFGSKEVKYNRLKPNVLKSSMIKDYLHGLPDTATEPDIVVSHVPLSETKKVVVSPTLLDKTKWNEEASRIDIIFPQTPPRSPSPEIYWEKPSDAGFSIPRNHTKSVDRVSSCKRKLEKEMETNDDIETKEACKYIKKRMTGSRGRQILAAMRGSKSEGSVKQKNYRTGIDPQSRHKRNTPVPLHPVLAGPSR